MCRIRRVVLNPVCVRIVMGMSVFLLAIAAEMGWYARGILPLENYICTINCKLALIRSPTLISLPACLPVHTHPTIEQADGSIEPSACKIDSWHIDIWPP